MNWYYWLYSEAVLVQREIHATLAGRLREFAETGDWLALLLFLPMGIVFGAVHAMTPGHGKILLATYLVGSTARTMRALSIAFILSATHVTVSVLIVLLALPLVTTGLGATGDAPLLHDLSRGLVGAIGLWLLWHAVFGHGDHSATENARRGRFTGFVAGLVPCPHQYPAS